jgi:hypothetical protein
LQVTFVTDANGVMRCVEDEKADQYDLDWKKNARPRHGRAGRRG